jgi:uncharacterized membrane protein YheB (UPF0754 family)
MHLYWWLLLIPFISAFIGWFINSLFIKMLFHPYLPKKLLGFTFQGIIPKQQQALAQMIGKYAATLFSLHDIEQKIADPKNIDKIMPLIEEHVDEFLRVKLIKEMPMIGMFIGDKTIASMKKIFMQELSTLFPEIMKNYAANLEEEINLQEMVTGKISRIPVNEMEDFVSMHLSTETRNIKLIGALTGFIIGLLQVLITILFGMN